MVKSSEPLQIEKGVICGDSLEILPKLPANFFQLILTDPPYGVSRQNNLTSLNRRGIDFGSWDKGFDQLSWVKPAIEALKPGGSIVIWNDWKNLGGIALYLESLGLSVKRILTWNKNNPFPRNIKRSFVQATEHALWAVKKGKWVFNNRQIKSYERGVFTYPVQRSPHPTKKPDGLFKELVEILSNEGDWVLDPFCGVGTTNWAAESCQRNHIGIEKDSTFAKHAAFHWRSANK